MARNIPQSVATAAQRKSVTPVLFVDLGALYSLVGSRTPATGYTAANFTVDGPRQRSGGTIEATVSLPGTLAGLMDHVAGTRLIDQDISISEAYIADGAYTDKILLLKGLVTDVSVDIGGVPLVRLTAVNTSNYHGVAPSIRLAPPLINWRTPEGTVVVWNNQTIGIDRVQR